MQNNRDFEIIISTCDKFSDLWDANIFFINQNWGDRRTNTYLVTDKNTEKVFDNVSVVCAGADTEITQRLRTALEKITSEFIVFTLDDYFLTTHIEDSKIQHAINVMKKEKLDYLRLYSATKHYLKKEGAKEISPGFYLRNINDGDYKISLYPGIWRTEFMRKTVVESMNAWEYEVALTPIARKLGARCAISNNNEFPFLDVIRKGKILRKAKKYFDKNPIYITTRETMTAKDEFMLSFRTWLRHYLPKPFFKAIKKLRKIKGYQFYSPE